jgi:FkbM family methyltransferase
VRRLRALRGLRGWRRVVNAAVPPDVAGAFVAETNGIVFAGDLSSFIDRQMYLFGQYEEQDIELFLGVIPSGRRGVVLDVGANVGTHSLTFARHFRQVHAFEPNPSLWAPFERNMELNSFSNVSLHKVGLGEEDAELPFFGIDKKNFGLGTFSTEQQYDLPLNRIAVCRVANGDRYLQAHGIGHVDAMKVDVQGFEPMVLRGCQEILARHRPVVWMEYGQGTRAKVQSAGDLEQLFPYPVALWRLVVRRGLLTSSRSLEPVTGDLVPADYFVLPK